MKNIKTHFQNHKEFYIGLGVGLTVAGITVPIMRDVISQSIKGANYGVLAKGANYGVLGEKIVVNNISYISSHRKGPPSWIIRCLETGDIFSSQAEASRFLEISASKISEQLNGTRNNAQGYHFERIGMAI